MRVNRDMAPFYSKQKTGKLHPVQYMSQKTTPAEEKYSSYELEVLAVVNALKKLRTYLLGNHFKIICSAFQKTMDKKDLVTRISRWALLLKEYDYEIVHRSGQRMQHVDALSRYPVTMITSDTLTA
ncbi:transposon Ty3-I Gag-Pol polyprotein [Trichonephila clavipes]|nr:transposon Ty3-I Gag-Pol polyprotein [Trichonephila clavipes]